MIIATTLLKVNVFQHTEVFGWPCESSESLELSSAFGLYGEASPKLPLPGESPPWPLLLKLVRTGLGGGSILLFRLLLLLLWLKLVLLLLLKGWVVDVVWLGKVGMGSLERSGSGALMLL